MESGKTLGELLAVLALVVLLMGFSLPSLVAWRQGASYRQAAREIVSAMRAARDHAISRCREVSVDFDLDANRYRLRIGDRPYGSALWEELRGWSSLPRQVRLAVTKSCDKFGDGDLSTPHVDTLQFNPNGTCGASGALSAYYICVMNEQMQPRFAGAVLSTTTGRAQVRDWDPVREEWR